MLRRFVAVSNFHRHVVIQSRFAPNEDEKKLIDKVYETGRPNFDWVTQEGNEEWTAYSEAIGKWKSNTRIKAIEL